MRSPILAFLALLAVLAPPAALAQEAAGFTPYPLGPAVEVPDADRARILAELKERVAREQALRREAMGSIRPGSAPDAGLMRRMRAADEVNTARLVELVARWGWIDAGRFGPEGSRFAFLIVQHSGDLRLMRTALPEVEKDVRAGKLDGGSYALLYDRTQLTMGNRQRYGTQVTMDQSTGEVVVSPLEDEARVDEFRKEMGMPPLAAYVRQIRAMAGLPPEEGKAGKPPVEMDDLSRKTFDGYVSKLYRLGAAGVKTASYRLHLKVSAGTGPIEVTGEYRWDGKQGELTWSEPRRGALLGRQGFSREQFDKDFRGSSLLDMLVGTKLTATPGEDGAVIVTVNGETEQGFRSFLFGANGLIEKQVMRMRGSMGGQADLTIVPKYRQEGEKWLPTGRSFRVATPNGELVQDVTVTYARVSGFWVRTRIEMKNTMGGKPAAGMVAEYSDWKLNEDSE